MPAIACCLLAQITPTSILFDDLLKDFGWVYRRRVTIYCVLARKKLQPDNKTTNFHQLGRNTSEPRRNSSQPEKDCASQENVQPSQKTHRPANISMLAFLMRPHDFLQRCINAALYSQLFFVRVQNLSSLHLFISGYAVFAAWLSSSSLQIVRDLLVRL